MNGGCKLARGYTSFASIQISHFMYFIRAFRRVPDSFEFTITEGRFINIVAKPRRNYDQTQGKLCTV